MKYFILFLVVIGLICLPASAYTFDNIEVNLENGAYLSFPYIMEHDGTFNQSHAYFQFWVNSSNLTFSTGSNRTVTGVTLNNGTDVYAFSSNGSVGWFNFSATMGNASNNYSFYINDSYIESRNTTDLKQVYFNYTISDTTLKVYKVNWTISEVESPVDLPDPNITSWGNNYTNNESLILYVEENTFVDFNITVNQSVDNYYWTVSSATALGHSEYNFTSHGTKYVTGRASNTNGSTQTITWTVNVNDTYPYVFPANSDTDLFIVNKNVVRKLNTETNEYVYKIILLKPVVTKVVTDTDQIYFNTLDRAYIVNKQNGTILHSYYFGRAELISNISVDSKNMNFNTESYIYSLNKTTGQLVQKFKLDDSSIYQ